MGIIISIITGLLILAWFAYNVYRIIKKKRDIKKNGCDGNCCNCRGGC